MKKIQFQNIKDAVEVRDTLGQMVRFYKFKPVDVIKLYSENSIELLVDSSINQSLIGRALGRIPGDRYKVEDFDYN